MAAIVDKSADEGIFENGPSIQGDAELGQHSTELASIEEVERVYKYVLTFHFVLHQDMWRFQLELSTEAHQSIANNKVMAQENRSPHHSCLLVAIFPLFCHPLQCRPGPDNE